MAQYRDRVESIHIARYWAMCAWFDETCGALLGFLDEQGLTEETLVVYVTDNGWINLPDAPRYAPRSKRSPYEGGIRTPMMLRWPGRITPRRSEDLAQSIDIAPTVLRAVGLDIPAAMQGINLLDAEAVGRRDMVSGDIYLHNAVDIRNPAPEFVVPVLCDQGMEVDPAGGRPAAAGASGAVSDPSGPLGGAGHGPGASPGRGNLEGQARCLVVARAIRLA
ncbi:MAG: sulfatase-like hydrolase/transferase [Verrucomicrobiota bacterium]